MNAKAFVALWGLAVGLTSAPGLAETNLWSPTCVRGTPASVGVGAMGLVTFNGVGSITIYANEALRSAGNYAPTLEHLQGAVSAWNQACVDPIGGIRTWQNIPRLEVNWEGTRPVVDAKAPWDSPSHLAWKTTVLVEYLPDVFAVRDAAGNTEFARHNTETNVIRLPGRCPDDRKPQQSPCTARGQYINYRYFDFGEQILMHELGHNYGISHDRQEASCDGGIMELGSTPGVPGTVHYGYCNYLERALDHRSSCNNVPAGALDYDGHPCEPGSPELPGEPQGDAGGICERVPDACDGQSFPPWGSAEEHCRYEAVYTTADDGTVIGTSFNHYCYLIIGRVELEQERYEKSGPLVHLDSPQPGAVLSGVTWIEGWAARLIAPAELLLTVDGESMPWASLQVGLSAPEACGPPYGLESWACNPKAGFRGSLDSRLLSNGPHVIQVVAIGSGLPTVIETMVSVSNGGCEGNTAPVVTLSAPSPGAVLQGSVGMSAIASDDGAISRVDFFVDGAPLGSDGSPPYSVGWNTAASSNGSHTLTATAVDDCGAASTTPGVVVSVQNAASNTPPQVWIDTPAAGATVSSRFLEVAGWATDAGGVASLQFRLDGALVQPQWTWVPRPDVCAAIPLGDPRCPNVGWHFTLDTLDLQNGSHTLDVVATDAVGASVSVQRSFTISRVAPTLVIDGPGDGRIVSGPLVGLWGWATSPSGIDEIRLEVDGAPATLARPWSRLPKPDACAAGNSDPACPDVGWNAVLDSLAFADGLHAVTVIARAASGAETSSTRNYIFRNNPVGTTSTVVAAEDTYVTSANPSAAYGSSTRLYVQVVTGDIRYSALKFDLRSLSGTVKSARLRLTLPLAAAPRVNVFTLTGEWSEATLTWSGMGGLVPSFFESFFGLSGGNTTVYIDVTDRVALGAIVSFAIANDSAASFAFNSSEYFASSTRPALIVVK